ncbi:TlpA family protein disulfide reductase [Algibacter pectinivorans]|uniref:AhpC/TSA family protein n=1 Tax=Algibacter pectinivorans TaxID=870482 RepID=A0A1I1QLV9_9FLAO|nr:redoxin family protein [Algibacter pectinivorans]SFD20263.1 AhpC/TSA family protein [Algibacter pectinivorans]
MKFNKIALSFLFLLCTTLCFGQINISEQIQPSSLAKQDANALYFVDFWATWCGPCIHVSKYLESLQEQYPNNFYVVSLTKESPDIVDRFMKKHKMNLAVAIDYEGETFKKNNVRSLPYGILYNAYGDELWKGHPADLKGYQIGGFLNKNKKTIPVSEMIKLHEYEKFVVVEEEIQEDELIITNLNFVEDNSELRTSKHKSYLELKGDLKGILAYTLNSHRNQIEIPDELNKSYEIRFKLDSRAYFEQTKMLLKKLKLKKTDAELEGEVIVFDIKDPRFWGDNEIDWGPDTPKFLIGDSEIKADGVSLEEVKYKLINLLDTPIVLQYENIDVKLVHDWDIHYKYFDLMVSGMWDSYGIDVAKKNIKYPKYVIAKRGFF